MIDLVVLHESQVDRQIEMKRNRQKDNWGVTMGYNFRLARILGSEIIFVFSVLNMDSSLFWTRLWRTVQLGYLASGTGLVY